MANTTITMYGTNWCGDCKRTKKFFGEQRVHYDFIDIENDPAAQALVERINNGKQIIPTLVFEDGSTLVEPSNAELAAKLGLQTEAKNRFYDLVIIGSGPAGLTAALYAAREGIETLVIERGGVGGQVGITERLDNFPGFPDGIGGGEFADRLRAQAERFGVEILQAQEATKVETDAEYQCIHTGDGNEIRAFAVVLAMGSTYRRLGIPGESDFIGAGIHFCATCDGPFYREKEVMVIGGGNSAGEESVFLTKFAAKVTIVTRDQHLSASKVVAQKVEVHPGIEVIAGHRPVAFGGDGRLGSVTVENIETGARRDLHPAGVFVFIGLDPNSEVVKDLVDVDERGFILTGPDLQTNVPGIFAAGDIRAGSTKQAAAAAGEGAAVAIAIRRFLQGKAVMRPMD